MNRTELVAVPYRIARFPLTLVELNLMSRVPDSSPIRLIFDRGLGAIDLFAGRILRDESLTRSGAGYFERVAKLARAADLEQVAAQRRQEAADTAREANRRASEQRAEAAERQRTAVADAVKAERGEKQAAAAKARRQVAKASEQADTRANRRLSTIQQGLRQTEAVSETRVHRAEEQAKAEFDEAATRQTAANRKRSEADQLGALAANRKTARKTS